MRITIRPLNRYWAISIPLFIGAVAYFAKVSILDYGEAAASHFAALRTQKIRIGTQDLRIAAIALAASAVLVTRNRQDFRHVPHLVMEDWSVATG